MTVVTVLPDGRVIAKVRDAYRVAPVGGGIVALGNPAAAGLSIADLRKVEQVLHVDFPSVSPATQLTEQGTAISANVVGITISAAAGTTLTAEVTALGF